MKNGREMKQNDGYNDQTKGGGEINTNPLSEVKKREKKNTERKLN